MIMKDETTGNKIPGDLKRKMKRYYQQQLKKRPDIPIVNIHEKIAKKFNVKFVK